MAQDVLPAVKHSSALLRVQLVDKVSGEVLIAVLVPGKDKQTDTRTQRDVNEESLQSRFCLEPRQLRQRGAAAPQYQTSLDAGLHLLQQMLHVGLNAKKEKK